MSIRTSTSPAASPATPWSTCACSGDYDWRLSEQNVWKVERMLLDYPHRPIRSSDRRIDRLRRRYVEYRQTVRTQAGLLPPDATDGRR